MNMKIVVKPTKGNRKFKSTLEKKVAHQLGSSWNYEPWSIEYSIPKTYYPDFVDEDKKIVLEAKGFFRWNEERKYLYVKEALKELGYELIMALENPAKPVRKGVRLSMSGWCEKHGIRWVRALDLREGVY